MYDDAKLGRSEDRLTTLIAYCAVCDAGRKALEVPAKPCRHSGTEHRRMFALPVVPVDPDTRLPGSPGRGRSDA
jgi:hypothetical protein